LVRCPDPIIAEKMIEAIDKIRVKGDSVGGVVTCIARNVPRVCISFDCGVHFLFVSVCPCLMVFEADVNLESLPYFRVWGPLYLTS
jgi:hypothetical protein